MLWGLIVSLFVACTSKEKQRLLQIENVLEESPDTAWAMLSQDENRLSRMWSGNWKLWMALTRWK